ncbi:NAD-dependent epimerase/dehydratase family protein [Nonomuraea rhizosphaerae]|uniref:NAD-dependent epimerase/dehydratase family protein n=1 Tax=Nonomuraea rhizosphaerae TaxID=2665663 RepID=UPI001C5E3EAD|nr:NAD(P)-dependent oxidoreductase [Nonomuraea rhizosphaerae]
MRVGVTGASGFAGGAVCRAAVARGWQVYGFGRRPADIPGVSYTPWELVHGEPPGVELDALIHCAGSVTDWGAPREIWQANVEGTRNAARAFPGARFVHVSTASVYDPRRPTIMAREHEAPVSRYVNAYGASKAAAERLLAGRLADGRAVVLRPHAVYGPGDTTLLPRVLRSVRGRRLVAVGDGRQRISLTSVGNLAEACLLAVTAPAGTYNVTDAEPVVLDDALRAVLREKGLDATPLYLPRRLAHGMAAVAETLTPRPRATHGRRRPPVHVAEPRLTRYAVGHLAVERTLDITAARDRLGYTPSPTSFAGASAW